MSQFLASLTPDRLAWNAMTLYLVAALLAAIAAIRCGKRDSPSWWAIAAIMALVGLDERLRLGDRLTAVLRSAAMRDHLYDQRKVAQLAFIIIAVAVLVLLVVRWWRASRTSDRLLRLALAGLTLVLLLLMVRMPSLHMVDFAMTRRIGGLRVSWLIEITAIGLVAIPSAIAAVLRK